MEREKMKKFCLGVGNDNTVLGNLEIARHCTNYRASLKLLIYKYKNMGEGDLAFNE